ncbi:MAG TPA: ATP-binding protein [Myxococcota bacterium]|jgi:hypothetical protein|nr:ATP-binding protein [Myxococcota bacterium]
MARVPLKFKVAPHIVEDLGLNLYTSLPRVLVEFVANAYDADSPFVEITLDPIAIERQRKAVKAQFDHEKALGGGDHEPAVPLATRALAEEVQIAIKDAGIGMSRQDLQDKFLVAGRRRRLEGEKMTAKGRAIMGRKGLGKLAGFGVAKTVTILTRKADSDTATRIVLRYDDLVKSKTADGYEVPEEETTDVAGLVNGGTIVILSQLLYDPTKSREATVENEIGDHFALIHPEDFKISLNGSAVVPTPRKLDYAWPDPALRIDDFVTRRLDLKGDDAGVVKFKYRLRFTAPKNALRASQRGVRIYANKRLAAAPSLLDADTNMHGFRMTDYLDGVVHADFIDEQELDYIATDRHGLRWGAPMLAELRAFLSAEIREACKQYQKKRDTDNEKEVTEDVFTKQQIDESALTASEKKTAMKVAKALGRAYGVDEEEYKTTLPSLVQAIGRGSILTAISRIADADHPHLRALVDEITRLTMDELEGFTLRAKARLVAIRSMKKVVTDVDFDAADNEKEIQKLFERNPWLIDPTYTQFLSADKRVDTLFDRLAKELQIGQHAGQPTDAESRPDLVFLLGNAKLGRLVIVELKSANKALDSSHLDQLELYMLDAEQWLTQNKQPHIKVEGQLIGTRARGSSKARKVILLRSREDKAGANTAWKVRDYLEVLSDTEAAHQELLEVNADAVPTPST